MNTTDICLLVERQLSEKYNTNQGSIFGFRVLVPGTPLCLSVAYLSEMGTCFEIALFMGDKLYYDSDLNYEKAKRFHMEGIDSDCFKIEKEISRLQKAYHAKLLDTSSETNSSENNSSEYNETTENTISVESLQKELAEQKLLVKSLQAKLAKKDEQISEMVRLANKTSPFSS